MEIFEIGTSSDLLLRFHSREIDSDGAIDSYLATIVSPGLEATIKVDNSPYGFPPSAFFERLASAWHDWKPEFDWRALEAELYLSASADALGHVEVTANFRGGFNQPWRATGSCILEAGQLDSVARRAAAFFGSSS